MGTPCCSENGRKACWLLDNTLPKKHLFQSLFFCLADETLNKEYLPVLGYEPFATAATCMILGSDSTSFKEGRAFGIQTLSGTGALRVGAEFLARIMKSSVVYSSNPTWGKSMLSL